MPRLTFIPWQRLVRVFEWDGFAIVRQEGDHMVMTKPGCRRPLVIPQWREVPVFIVRNNLRSAGMSRERYFELLDKS
ncbi:MAG: type II toxin-antitoxin system HicA family toxin [Thermoflexales bacterium]|nr:type II toxin-antitoxin system HicA family toxin [Thermoflexales bacterium]